jgi:hypothetical protein
MSPAIRSLAIMSPAIMPRYLRRVVPLRAIIG